MDVQNPGMPDLQFVLFVSALCTSNLTSINVPKPLAERNFQPLLGAAAYRRPADDPNERVLDLRHGTELTLEACLSTIRSLLSEAGINTLIWDHPVSDATRDSTPAAKPLIDRLGQLYPEDPDIVDPPPPPSSGHSTA